jgi:hypothetical protein
MKMGSTFSMGMSPMRRISLVSASYIPGIRLAARDHDAKSRFEHRCRIWSQGLAELLYVLRYALALLGAGLLRTIIVFDTEISERV